MSTTEARATRRDFLKSTAAVGAAVAVPGALAERAGAASRVFVARRQQQGTVVVATMPGPRWEGALRASAKTYMRQNKDVKVEFVVSPFTEHYQRIGTALQTDSSDYDIFVFDRALMGQSYPKLQPLDDLFDQNKAWRDYYLKNVPYQYRGSWDWPPGKKNAVHYSVVHDANAMMAWWRTDVFKRLSLPIPTTFETMVQNATKLDAIKQGSGFLTTAARDAHLAVLVTGMMWAYGGRWWENDVPNNFGVVSKDRPPGKILLDSREMIESMATLKSLIKIGNPASLNAREFENNAAFISGRNYQQLMWSGLMVLQNPRLNPRLWNKMISADFPIGGNNKDKTKTGIKGGFGLAIPKASSRVELAFDFCRHTTSKGNAQAFILGGGQPANINLLKEWSKKPGFQVFGTIAQGIIHGHHQGGFPEGGEFYKILFTHGGAILTGDVTPAKGCVNMRKDTERLFKRAGYI
jgi:ABC-type glycerol-3-phosphate transport system substrate-binding protein